jgi:hypothetical protein
MIWMRWPNGQGIGSAMFHRADAAEIILRGWLIVDGVRARACWEDDDKQTVRLYFESHFREHP